MKKHKVIFISLYSLVGALFLSLLSIPQKILLGASLFTAEGFVVPIVFGGVVGFIIGSAQLRLKLNAQDLETLLSVSQEITATTELRQLYRNITTILKELLSLDFSTLMILSDDGKHLIIQDTIGFPESMIGTFSLVEGQGLSTHVIKTQKPGSVPDFSKETRFEVPPVVIEKKINSAICVPMMIRNETFGVLIGHTLSRRDFSRQDFSLYQSIANQAAVAIKNSINLSALKQSEQRYLSLVDDSKDMIYRTSRDGRFLDVNPAGLSMFGYTRDEMIGMDVLKIYLKPSDRLRFQLEIEKEGYVRDFELKFKKKDGSIIDCILTSTVQKNASGNIICYQGIIRDDTERKRHEDEISLLRTIAMSVSETEDLHSALAVTVQRVCETTGWALGEAWVLCEDCDHLEFSSAWHRRDLNSEAPVASDKEGPSKSVLDRSRAGLERLIEKSREFTFERGVGLPGRVWESMKPLWIKNVTIDTNFPRAKHALEAGIKASMGMPILAGRNLVAVLCFFTYEPREEDSRLLDLVSSVAEQIGSVLHKKQVEDDLRKSEEKLRQSQKLESVGQLAGGIAHDFNNILTAIMGYATMLRMKLKDDDPIAVYTDNILASSERAANLTQKLLAFSRKQIIKPRPADMNEIIRGMGELAARLIGEDIELRMHLADEALTAMADTGQMEQVLMNLCTNARDAMPDGGVLTIESDAVYLDERYLKAYGNAQPGRYALISVSDTGTGMDEETKDRIFEPFFTTKEAGKGTGLGLSMIYGIIKQHNGIVSVYSEQGKGTTFKICLPLTDATPEEKDEVQCVPLKGGTETILLADDDPGVRSSTSEILRQFGYAVIEAEDGEDAVQKFRENKERIGLVILDIVMPKMNGKDAFNAIRNIAPEVKALFTSGYTANIIHKKGVLESDLNFISKPAPPRKLLMKIREVIDG